MDSLTLQIADFAQRFDFAGIPAEIVHRARQRVFDTVGCALGGAACEAARIGRKLARGAAPDFFAGRILGQSQRTSAETAAFVNTSMIRYLDFNDGHHAGHPSDMIGPLLALAESSGADGRRLLAGVVVAYEVALRFIRATKLRELGWDQGFAVGIGAVAGLGNMLRLPRDQIGHAIAITAVANVPLRASRAGHLSHWKGAATAFACRNAVFATLLASDGLTGPDKPFEGRHGLFEQITGPFALPAFPDEGGAFILPQTMLKFWPADGNVQTAIWAALQLRAEMSVDDIAAVDIGAHWGAWHENASEPEKWAPTTRETADHSMPYVFARALVDGTIGLQSFEPECFTDPALHRLLSLITVHKDDAIEERFQATYPHPFILKVDVTAKNGQHRLVEIVDPRGLPQNPMDDRELEEKFIALAAPVLGAPRAASAAAAWREFDTCSDLADAMSLLDFASDGGSRTSQA